MAPGLARINEHNVHEGHYKLTFLDMPGCGEVARYIFAYAGVDYVANRVTPMEMELLEEKIPWGLLPILEIDGQIISMTNPIAQFLGRRFGLAGTTDIEEAKISSVGSFVTEAMDDFFVLLMETDKERAAQLKQQYLTVILPRDLNVFQRELSRNTTGNQNWFIGDTPTWCDFSVALFMRLLQNHWLDALDNFPLLRKHCERVYQLNGIREHVAALKEQPRSGITHRF